jgi:hypothetical protein
VAKKRKGSRPSSAKAGKKKKTAKSRSMVSKPATGLESKKHVDFGPLKKHLYAHIDRLSKVKDPSPSVLKALSSLQQVSADLTGECQPSMILHTP